MFLKFKKLNIRTFCFLSSELIVYLLILFLGTILLPSLTFSKPRPSEASGLIKQLHYRIEKIKQEDFAETEQREERAQEKVDYDELFKKARTIAFQGKRKEAREICMNILEKKPGYHDVRVFLGRLYAWDKKYGSARKELQEVLENKAGHLDARNALIDVEYWSNHTQLALIYCEEGLDIDPNNQDFLLKKARILVKMENLEAASESIHRLLGINPSHEEALQLLERIQFLTEIYNISLRYRFDKFERGQRKYGPWHFLSFELSRKFGLGSVIARANYASRNFGSGAKSGTQFEIDAYPKITKGFYAYLNAGYSSYSIFPKYRFGGELYTSLPKSFELSAGVRYLDFSSSRVVIYTGNLGKYHGNYWFSFRPFVTAKTSGYSFSGIFIMRRYFQDAENHLSLLFGFGSSPVEIFFLEDIERLNSYKIELEFQKSVSRTFLIDLGVRFEREEFRVEEFGNRITFSITFQQRIFKKY